MRNVYIGLLVESILFVLLTLSLTMETKKLRLCVRREFPSREVGLGFSISGEGISEQSISLFFCPSLLLYIHISIM